MNSPRQWPREAINGDGEGSHWGQRGLSPRLPDRALVAVVWPRAPFCHGRGVPSSVSQWRPLVAASPLARWGPPLAAVRP
jgi:hypothetical protein